MVWFVNVDVRISCYEQQRGCVESMEAVIEFGAAWINVLISVTTQKLDILKKV